jgi:hypothetical protein
MKENKILKDVLLLSRGHIRLFRNNVGVAFVGTGGMSGTTAILANARRIRFGLCKGSSDAIGWTTINITPDMVGGRVAVFTAIETKTQRGVAAKLQKNFINTVVKAGGIAGIAKTQEEAKKIINSFTPSV